mmetsp:Transcript_21807/g.63460  ORF Transcript_21807/g.63460 Transcript_21807/m.63460 type:complete len:317 (+) Transcript_21807:283-1233(+)
MFSSGCSAVAPPTLLAAELRILTTSTHLANCDALTSKSRFASALEGFALHSLRRSATAPSTFFVSPLASWSGVSPSSSFIARRPLTPGTPQSTLVELGLEWKEAQCSAVHPPSSVLRTSAPRSRIRLVASVTSPWLAATTMRAVASLFPKVSTVDGVRALARAATSAALPASQVAEISCFNSAPPESRPPTTGACSAGGALAPPTPASPRPVDWPSSSMASSPSRGSPSSISPYTRLVKPRTYFLTSPLSTKVMGVMRAWIRMACLILNWKCMRRVSPALNKSCWKSWENVEFSWSRYVVLVQDWLWAPRVGGGLM